MQKLRFWLIKKLIGNTPVIMNVTLNVSGSIEIQGAEEVGLFDKWHIEQKQEEGKQNDKAENRNTRRRNARAKR